MIYEFISICEEPYRTIESKGIMCKTFSRLEINGHCGTFHAFIFDFDGTLAQLTIDFTSLKARIDQEALNYLYDLPPSSKPILERIDEIADMISQKIHPSVAEQFMNRALNIVIEAEIAAAFNGLLFPFTRPLLSQLMERKYGVAIVTRNCEAAVRKVFPDIDNYCHVFLPRECVKHVKPHPEHIISAITMLGESILRRNGTILIGDHTMDIHAGLTVGIWTAGVASGRLTQQELIEAGAYFVANNCEELFREFINSLRV